jgi:hypothetical protein
MPHNLTEKIQQ